MLEGKQRTAMDLALLVLVSIAVNTYLVATTVLISGDGVIYMERAQQAATALEKIVNLNEPPGFPILISGLHALISMFVNSDSLSSWIYAGQSTAALCTTAAIATLYLLGQKLFSAQEAFWGLLVLILLPYPAHWGADVLRDWPHLFFLSASLLLLYKAVERQNAALFLAAGLASGVGYIIRPECAQVVLYAAVVFVLQTVCAFRRRESVKHTWKFALLAAGFLSVFLLLASQQKRIVPHKLDDLIRNETPGAARSIIQSVSGPALQTAGEPLVPGMIGATAEILKGLTENLLYYFAVPAAIGFYLFVKHRRGSMPQLFIIMIVVFYMAVLTALQMRWGYISRRHLLPLTAIFCCFIPAGTEWLARKLFAGHYRTAFYVLICVGLLICLPKLTRPLGSDKKPYLDVISWIAAKTPPGATLYTCDNRLPFYAERPYYAYRRNRINRRALKSDYWIVLSKDGQPQLQVPEWMKLEQRFDSGDGRELWVYSRVNH